VVKIEIEIPDPPEGWVVDGYRKVVAGEMALFDNRQWSKCQYSGTDYSYLVAVKAKPIWEPSPELVAVLMPGWIARDKDQMWFWYSTKPTRREYNWNGRGAYVLRIIHSELLPPNQIPWDQCCFKIGDPE
jgi:hypothetical protein